MTHDEPDDEYRQPQQPLPPDYAGNQWDAEQDASSAAPRPGLSGGTKTLLVILGVGGVCCLLCCGGAAFFIYSFVPKVSSDPAAIDAVRDHIAKIKLPAGYAPARMFSTDNLLMSMTAAVYENPAVQGHFVLTQVRVKFGKAAQAEAQVRQQFLAQSSRKSRPLDDIKTHTRNITIKGHDCPFEFIEGIDPSTMKKVRRVLGSFEGKHGQAWVALEMDDSAYHENEIVKMLESIQ